MTKNNLFLLDGLTDADKTACWAIDAGHEQAYNKGAVIYNVDHADRALALVLHGTVRVTHGRVVMNDLHAGDVFGAAALFGGDEPYPSTVTAHTACRVLFLPQQTVSRWMAANPQIAENYIRFLSGRIRFLNRRLATLTAGQTDGKLWQYLLAHRNERNTVHLDSGVSALAKSLDMGRSSLYRSLDALVEAGKIRRDGKTIEIIIKGDIHP